LVGLTNKAGRTLRRNNMVGGALYVTDLIRQVSQLLRAELEELVDVAQATIEPIELCDEEW